MKCFSYCTVVKLIIIQLPVIYLKNYLTMRVNFANSKFIFIALEIKVDKY